MRRFFVAIAAFAALGASSFADSHKPVLGYLGQAVERTRIYAAPNSHARCYARTKVNQYLVVKDFSETWDKVLLNNMVYGYVKVASLKRLPYEVTARGYGARGGGIPFEQGSLASRSGMAQYAMNYIGRVSYRFGGNSFSSGMDCSAFVKEMYGKIGVNLPRTAAQQALVGQPVYRLEQLQPGDRLYFWESKRGMIGHTGIYEGNGYFLHNSHGKGGVATSYLSPSWRSILVAARR